MTRRTYTKTALLTGACLIWMLPVFAQEATTPPTAGEEVETEARQQTVVVRGEYIPDEKRSTSEVSSLIDEADFALQGDSDAAAALARVVGISTADDEFIYVRGLNERYSSALLNGSPLPSPAPLRRVAPLDLFPTSALKSVLVQKTFSPNLPGEFGGGLVNLRTKAVPNERFLTLDVSAGIDSISSLEDGLLYDGSDTDLLGFDDGARDLPAFGDNGLTPDVGRQLTDNSSLLVLQKSDVGPGPNFSVGATGGERIDVNDDLSVGFLGSVSYSNSWKTEQGRRGTAVLDGDGIRPFFETDQDQTTNKIGLNALGILGFDIFDNHEIKFTGLITRSTDKRGRINFGTNADQVVERVDSLEWFERQLWFTQASGEHVFDNLLGLEVNWRASYSEAQRDAPFQLRNTYREQSDGELVLATETSDNSIQFSRVDDDSTDFGIDFTLPLEFGDGSCTYFCEVDLKGGYSYVENDRFSSSRIFGITGVGAIPSPRNFRLDYIYASIFASGNGAIQEVGNTVFPPIYLATLEVDAGYAGIDAQLTPYLRASVGARVERAIQAVDTQVLNQDPATNFVESCIERQTDGSCDHLTDVLPAFTITWNPIEDIQVRAGYSETLTRPQFRELAPQEFLDTKTNIDHVGNPFLENASVKNYDARAEYYFARDQFLTFGLFYKDLERPIEEVDSFRESGSRITYLNAPSAKLYGFEIEYEQIWPIHQWLGADFFSSKEFQVKTNYTWSDSEVSSGRDPNALGLTGTEFCAQFANECVAVNRGLSTNPTFALIPASGQVRDGRRLQGQSEHLFNLQFGLLDDQADSEMNLLVNFVSKRIRTVGAVTAGNFLPDVIEEPPTTVDFVWNKGFEAYGGDYEFSLNIENILGEDYKAFQERGGDHVDVDTYDIGRVFTVGLKRRF